MSEPVAPFDPYPALELCREKALQTARQGNSPIAAVAVTATGELLGVAVNRQYETGDVTCHAERLLLTDLAERGVPASACWVVSNAEPCSMCASALVKAHVLGVAYGAAAEPSMDPWIPVRAVMAAARHPVPVLGPLSEEHDAHLIAAGRTLAEQARHPATQ